MLIKKIGRKDVDSIEDPKTPYEEEAEEDRIKDSDELKGEITDPLELSKIQNDQLLATQNMLAN